ncbi:MAG TPA: hypothetical protein VK604_16525 [Bryobacteraceae bacterium]|nr:hypothetical protein [Bryobacteraceae bacterium]HTF62562.1 hypothetical protein [Edaphobacter sp.]
MGGTVREFHSNGRPLTFTARTLSTPFTGLRGIGRTSLDPDENETAFIAGIDFFASFSDGAGADVWSLVL